MTAREPPEDIPRQRIEMYLPRGWICLSPDDTKQLIRLLRNYSQETYVETGVPVVFADYLADRLEGRHTRWGEE